MALGLRGRQEGHHVYQVHRHEQPPKKGSATLQREGLRPLYRSPCWGAISLPGLRPGKGVLGQSRETGPGPGFPSCNQRRRGTAAKRSR